MTTAKGHTEGSKQPGGMKRSVLHEEECAACTQANVDKVEKCTL